MTFLDKFFERFQATKTQKTSSLKGRRLGMENLENREMLSVNPLAPISVEGQSAAALFSTSTDRNDLETPVTNAAPANFQVTGQSADSVTLAWDVAQDPTTAVYTLQYKKTTDLNWLSAASPASDAIGATISGLAEHTAYDFRLAIDGGEFAEATATTEYKALDLSSLDVSVTQNSATLEWEAQKDVEYVLQYKKTTDGDLPENWTTEPAPAGTATTATITGLLPDTSYDFKLTVSRGSETPVDETVSKATWATVVAPDALAVTSKTDTSVTFEWTNEQAGVTYTMEQSIDGGANWTEAVISDVGAKTATVTGLTAFTEYQFQLTASRDGDTPQTSTPAVTVTTSPAAPTVTSKTHNTATISWTVPGSITVDEATYVLEWLDDSDDTWKTWASFVPDTTEKTGEISNLDPGKTYEFRLVFDDTDVSPTTYESGSATVTTMQAALAISVDDTTSSSVELSWSKPAGSIVVASYKLEYRITGQSTWNDVPVTFDADDPTVSATATGLTQNTKYDFRFSYTDEDGIKSMDTTENVSTLYKAPTSFHTSARTDETITVSWKLPEGVIPAGLDFYTLEWEVTGTGTWVNSYQHTINNDDAVSYTVTGLSANESYDFRLKYTASGPDFTVSEYAYLTAKTLFAAPTNITATGVASGSVTLDWDDPDPPSDPSDTSDVTAYSLQYRKVGDTEWSTAPAPAADSTTATVFGLEANTEYEFQLAVNNGVGLSAYSTPINAWTLYEAPTDFVEDAVTNNSVAFTWTIPDGVTITGATLQYKDPSDGEWKPLSGAAVNGVTATGGTITGLTPNTEYELRVAFLDDSTPDPIGSDYTTSITVKTLLAAPTLGFQETANTATSGSITLEWTAQPGATGYTLQYREAGMPDWEDGPAVAADATGATVEGLEANKTYNFRLSYTTADNESVFTSDVSASTLYEAPNLGEDDTAKTGTSVKLDWTLPTDVTTVTAYTLEYQIAGGDWSSPNTFAVPTTATTIDVTGLLEGTAYDFRLSYTVGTTDSDFAVLEDILTLPGAPVFAVSTDVGARTSTSIKLDWTAPAGAIGCTLQYRETGETEWLTVENVDVTAETATIDGLLANTEYDFRLSIETTVGTSDFTEVLGELTLIEAMAAPTVTTLTDTSIVISWVAPADVASYTLQYMSNNDGTWHDVTTVPGDTSATLSATQNTNYSFRLSYTSNINGNKSEFATVSALTKFSMPTITSATPGADSVTLEWTLAAPSTGVAEYYLEYKLASDPDVDESWTRVPVTDTTAMTATVPNLDPDTVYDFRLAVTNVGEDEKSAYATVSGVQTLLTAPQNFVADITAPSTSTITLTWDLPANVDTYTLEYKESTSDTWLPWPGTALNPTDVSAQYATFAENTSYDFRLSFTSTDSAKTSDYATILNVWTFAAAPSAPAVVSKTSASVTLEWSVEPNATGYSVQYKKMSDTSWTTVPFDDPTAATGTIRGLDPNVEYEFQMAVVNAAGISAYSAPVQNVMTMLAAPGNFVATDKTDESVTLSWTIPAGVTVDEYKLEYRVAGGSTWTILTPEADATEATIIGLTAGTAYEFRLSYTTLDNTSEFVTATATTWAALTAPVNFVADTVTNNSVTLTWDAQEGVTYELWYTVAGGTFTKYSEPAGDATSATITDLAANTEYAFQLIAIRGTGEEHSDVTATTLAIAAPATPTDLLASNPTSDSMTLTWTAVADATGYTVQYRKSGDTAWSTMTVTEATATVTGLEANTAYEFQVAATNDGGISAFSTSVFETTDFAPLTAPALAVGSKTDSSMTLTWDAQDGVTYTLQYKLSGTTTWQTAPAPAGDATSATISGLLADTAYDFRLIATRGGANMNSEIVTDRTLTVPAPVTPTDLAASAATSNSVTLTWTAVADATGYTVQYRKSGDTAWSTMTVTEATATVIGLDANTAYEFQVAATNDGGISAFSESMFQATDFAPLTAPENFVAADKTDTSVTLTWDAQAGVDSYKLEYRTADGTWVEWTTPVDPTATTATVTGLTASTEYEFRLTAIRGTSEEASTVIETTNAVPAPTTPTGLAASDPTSDSVTLTWNAVADATGYTVQYRAEGTDEWISVTVTSGTETVITGLAAGTTYEFQVAAVNEGGSSAFSASVTETTATVVVPDMPATASAYSASGNKTEISWSAVEGATTYQIVGYNAKGNYWWIIGETTDTSFSANAFTTDVTMISVHAVNEAGRSSGKITSIFRAPTGISAIVAVGNTTEISWNAVEGATSYDVMGYNAMEGKWWKIGTTNETSITAPGYTANVTMIAVHAIRDNERTVGATASLFRGPAEASALVAPGNQTLISWSAVAGATSYDIWGYNAKVGQWWNIGRTNGTSFDAPGYTADVTMISIHAIRGEGEGEERTVGTTTSLFRGPSEVSAIATASSTDISWSLVPGATKYDIWGYNAVDKYWWWIGETTNTEFTAQSYTTNVTTIAVHAFRGEERTAGSPATIVR